MADRVVAVGLTANTASYVAGMNKASQAAQRTATETEKIGSKVDKTNQKLNTMKNIALYAFGYGVAQGVVMAGKAVIGMAMDFEDSMARLKAASGEVGASLDAMREAALDAGQDTVFTATQAADAMTELSKAGVSTADIMGGALTGALDLASAGELDVAFAAETAATAMVQFNLSGRDMAHIADLLAAGAGKAQGDVEDLALALRQGGQVAAMVGWELEDTTTTLTAFAAAGLLGSDAGTSLKTMLLRLANPTAKAAEVMERYGLSVYDASGNMIGAPELAGRLTRAFANLSPEARNAAMGIIFGTDAVRAANVLFANGQSGIEDWSEKVNDAGYASEVAAAKTDTLRGDLNRLRGTIDYLINDNSSGLNTLLRTLTQVTDQLLKGGPAVEWGPLVGIQQGVEEAKLSIEELKEQGKEIPFSPAIQLGPKRPEGMGLYDASEIRGNKGLSGEISTAEAAVWMMTRNLEAYSRAQEAAAVDTATLMVSTGKLAPHLERAGRTADVAAADIEDLAAEAEAAQDEIDALKDAIMGFGSTALEADEAHDALTQAIKDARQPFRDLADAKAELAAATTDEERAAAQAKVAQAEAAITLKGNSDAALENRDNLRGLAEQAKETAAAFIDGTAAGADEARREMQRGRDEFIKTAIQMGINEQAAEDLATEYGLLPKKKQTDAIFMSAEAQARVDAYRKILDDVPRDIITRISTIEDPVQRTHSARLTGQASQYGTWKNGKWVPNKKAKGGWVRGPGSGTSDSIPAMLSNGEYVLSARMARVFGPLMESMRTGGRSVDNSRHLSANTVNLMTPDPSREWDFMNDLASVT